MEKPEYHLNNGKKPQKVEHDSQQFTSGKTTPQEGETIAAQGEDLVVGQDITEEQAQSDGPLAAFEGFDWDLLLKENAIPTTNYSELYEANKEAIAEAEKELGPKAEAVFLSYGEMYELDKAKLSKATDGQIDALLDAIEGSRKIEDANKKIDELESQISNHVINATLNLGGIWKDKWSVNIAEFPELEAKIPAKLEWLEANAPNSPKIEALKSFKDNYEKWVGMVHQLDELKEGSPKGDVGEYQKTIASFQDQNSLYSISRKNKAVWCKSQSESEKQFLATSQKQRAKMTSAEISSLQDYTGSGYSTINRPLNALSHSSGWGSEGKAKAKDECRKMTAALDKCASEKDVWLQRGVSDMHFGGMDFSELSGMSKKELEKFVGREYINNSFMSCGSSKGSGFSGSLILNIYCPKGTKMHYVGDVSYYHSENETIIQRGYHFKITKIQKKGYQYYMDVDLLLGSDADKLTEAQVNKLYDKYLK